MSLITPCRKLKRKSAESFKEETATQKKPRLSSKSLPTQKLLLPPETGRRCNSAFFDCPCEEVARNLLGCVLVRVIEGEKCCGRIVETEAYLGGDDKAAHSYNGKRTERNEAMYMPPGTAYVYSIYGMHCCFNISSRGGGAAVLIRALEPLVGVAGMMERRKGGKKERDLCNGPAKLCQALSIDRTCNKLDLVSSQILWVEFGVRDSEGVESGGPAEEEDVVRSGRVGVEYAGQEWASKPLRFYIRNCPYVSKK